MAGVPSVFEAMLDKVVPTLKTGAKLISRSVPFPFGEGVIGTPLAAIQKTHPDTIIGSYPRMTDDGRFATEIVIRARAEEKLAEAENAVRALLAQLASEAAKGQA